MATNGVLDFQSTNKLIFRGTSANVVIDTQNLSLGVGHQGEGAIPYKLHVTGDANGSTTFGPVAGLGFEDSGVSFCGIKVGEKGTSPYSRTALSVEDNGNTILHVDGHNQRIGIGTTTPEGKLEIGHYGSAIGDLTALCMTNHATNLHGTVLTEYNLVVSDVDQGTGLGNGVFSIAYRDRKTGSLSHRLVINSDGNVGVGETTPPAKMYVKINGNASFGGAWNTSDFVVSHGVGTTAPSQSLGVAMGVDGTGDANTSRGYLWCMRPNLSWNTLKIQAQNIELIGLASVTLQNGNNVTSDDRLKTEEEFLQNALPTIMKLKPQTYRKHPFLPNDPSKEVTENMTDMPSDLSRIETGLIVQDIWYDAPELRHLVKLGDNANPPEVRPVDPDPSDPTQDPDYSSWGTTPTTLEYQGVFVVAIKAIQELTLKNDALEARIAALENNISS